MVSKYIYIDGIFSMSQLPLVVTDVNLEEEKWHEWKQNGFFLIYYCLILFYVFVFFTLV